MLHSFSVQIVYSMHRKWQELDANESCTFFTFKLPSDTNGLLINANFIIYLDVQWITVGWMSDGSEAQSPDTDR